MKNLISNNGMYQAERIGKNEIQVTTIKGRSIYTSYVIMATAAGSLGSCSCAYGRRAGTECPHMSLVKEFVAAEQEPVVEVKVVNTLQQWLKEQEDDGIILFA